MHPPMAQHLTTTRLVLRPLDDGDVETYREMITERGVERPPADVARGNIARQHAVMQQHGFCLLALEKPGEARFLGYCGIVIGRSTPEEPELAYELLRRFQGNGYATEAARAVLDAIAQTGRGRLWSTVRSWNAPSFRVLEKLDFTRDHVTSDERGDIVWLTRALSPLRPSLLA